MKALDDLPRSIDDTYTLILERTEMNNIDERSYQLMIRILRWLVGASRPMKLGKLAEAIPIEPGQKFLNLDTVVNEPERMVEVCGSLVRKDPDTSEIFLAHYSIKEFLTSDRILRHEDGRIDVRRYHLDLAVTNEILARSCLNYYNLRALLSGLIAP